MGVRGQSGLAVTVLLTTDTGNRQLANTDNWQAPLKQQRNVKRQHAHQAAAVIPGFVEIKAPVRGTIGQLNKLPRLIGIVHVKNEVAILAGSTVVDDQAMIDRFKTGDINVPDSRMGEFVLQPFCHPFLPRAGNRKNNPPVPGSPVCRPPKTEVVLYLLGLTERKIV